MTTGSVHRFDVFQQAEQTAHDWLATVSRYLDTEDQHRAYRVARAWLHTVRDRLPVDTAVHFAAQLPLTWRGLFFDGWLPHQVPVKYDADQFLVTVAQDADLTVAEARAAAAAVAAAIAELTSAEQVSHLLAALPGDLRDLLRPATGRHLGPGEPAAGTPAPRSPGAQWSPGAQRSPGAPPATELPLGARVERLETDVQVIEEALGVLLETLDERPSSEPEPGRTAGGARRAHQILLSRRSAG